MRSVPSPGPRQSPYQGMGPPTPGTAGQGDPSPYPPSSPQQGQPPLLYQQQQQQPQQQQQQQQQYRLQRTMSAPVGMPAAREALWVEITQVSSTRRVGQIQKAWDIFPHQCLEVANKVCTPRAVLTPSRRPRATTMTHPHPLPTRHQLQAATSLAHTRCHLPP
ncbi:hypothetical protein GWK47_029371 [Chionoecetes opilio]|uniref:Uncharacterized protein n=1 Tax=Chionoecetes opilio TaxID=41210 RepID=A0A8J5D331_CHIOP|nr:hypothetical protein GWK47_029371 [Chionoecetes opilio]